MIVCVCFEARVVEMCIVCRTANGLDWVCPRWSCSARLAWLWRLHVVAAVVWGWYVQARSGSSVIRRTSERKDSTTW